MTKLEWDSLRMLSIAPKKCGYAWPGYSSLANRGYAECLTDSAGNVTGYRITHAGSRALVEAGG